MKQLRDNKGRFISNTIPKNIVVDLYWQGDDLVITTKDRVKRKYKKAFLVSWDRCIGKDKSVIQEVEMGYMIGRKKTTGLAPWYVTIEVSKIV